MLSMFKRCVSSPTCQSSYRTILTKKQSSAIINSSSSSSSNNNNIIKTLKRANFHITLSSSRAILSEKDFEQIHQQQQQVEQVEIPTENGNNPSSTKSSSQFNSSTTATTNSSKSNNNDNNNDKNNQQDQHNDPSLFGEFMKKKQQEENDLEGYNNPFYRDVDEKTAIEYQDAINDKESTPFPTWMMNFYRVASISVLLIVCYGLVVAKLDEQSINERYSLLEKKRKEREEQMKNLQFELELTSSVKDKKSIFAGLKALTQEEK